MCEKQKIVHIDKIVKRGDFVGFKGNFSIVMVLRVKTVQKRGRKFSEIITYNPTYTYALKWI